MNSSRGHLPADPKKSPQTSVSPSAQHMFPVASLLALGVQHGRQACSGPQGAYSLVRESIGKKLVTDKHIKKITQDRNSGH